MTLVQNDTPLDIDASGAQVQVLSPGGTELRALADTGVTIDGATASLSLTWAAATYPVDEYYKLVWELVSGGVTYHRVTFFSVMLRTFETGLTDAGIFSRHHEFARIVENDPTFSLLSQRQQARRRLELDLIELLKDNPARIANPEIFQEAHEALTLHFWHRADSFDPNLIGWEKARDYKKEYHHLLRQASQRVSIDRDDSGEIEPEERKVKRSRRFLQ